MNGRVNTSCEDTYEMLEVNRYVLRFLSVAIVFASVSSYRSVEPSYSTPLNSSSWVASDTNITEAFFKSTNAKYSNKDYQGGISDYNEVIRINPNYSEIYNNSGNDNSTDKREFNREVGKILLAPWTNLINSFLFLFPFFIAYGVKLYLDSNSAISFFESGIAKYNNKDYEGAIPDYNEAIRLNPDYAEAYHSRGTAKYGLGDKQGALIDLKEAARLYQEQGNTSMYKEAQDWIRKL